MAKHALLDRRREKQQNMTKSASIGDCYEAWKKMNQNILNPLTFHRYSNLVEKHLLPCFADVLAQDITEQEIDDFVEKKQNENMSKVTLNMLIMLFKRLLQIAGVDTVRLGLEHVIRVKTNKRTVEIMEEADQYLLDKVLKNNEEKNLSICLAFKMGLAVGEICALEWRDIDFDKEIIHVKESVQRIKNSEGNEKKTLLVKMPLSCSAKRELPIPEAVLRALEKYKKQEGYVLKCKAGGLPDPRREQTRLGKLFKKQEMKEYNFHTLRDTFAVRCLRVGMSMENLSYVLGHARVTITAERYCEFLEITQERTAILRTIMEMV